MRMGGQRRSLAALPAGKTQYPFMGGGLGNMDGLYGCEKSRHHRNSIPGSSSS